MPLTVAVTVYFLFVLMTADIVRRRTAVEAFLVVVLFVLCALGEVLNITRYHATAYPGIPGFPLYIVTGGALLGWGLFRLTVFAARRLGKDTVLFRFAVFLLLSSSFPLIEISGVTAGLWYWLKPCSYTSVWWITGVWKFYMSFMGIPVMIALCFQKKCKSPE